MHSCEGKCYSITETAAWLKDVGFAGMQFTSTAADRSIITARK